MDQERKEQQHRLRNREKSDASKIAWKKHHSSYMRGTRKRVRNMENTTFYTLRMWHKQEGIKHDKRRI